MVKYLNILHNSYPAIQRYTSRGASKYNKQLLLPNPDKEPLSFESELNKELHSLPTEKFEILYAHEGSLYNSTKLKQWFSNHLGEIVVFPNFLSTSYKKWKEQTVRFTIYPLQNSAGKNIEKIGVKAETEVLFPSKTRFRIVEVNESIRLDEYRGEQKGIILYECFEKKSPALD